MIRKCLDICRNLSSRDFLTNTAEKLYELEKNGSFSSFFDSSSFVMDKMREAGFTDIERISMKADGVTEAFDAVMPQAWDRTGRCFLEITGDVPEDLPQIIADTDETTFATSAWSGATSPDGDTGEVVFYDAENPDSMRGKWVFFDSMPRGAVTVPLFRAGAAGVITTDFKQGAADPDATRWLNGTGTYGWYHLKDEPHIPMFCLTARRAGILKKHLENGRKITVRGVINTRIYDGEIYTVTGIIPGEDREEFAIIGHMYEPFLNDNACGVAAAIETGRILASSGVKPKKTLRVIFSMEHYGLAQYYARNLHTHKMFAALNIDCLTGYTYRELEDELHFRLSPPTAPYAGDLILEYMLRNFAPDLRWSTGFGNLSDDTIGGAAEINVPTNWIYSKTNIFHHTSGRFYADVDWEMSHILVELLAAYVIFTVTAGKQDIRCYLSGFEKLALAFLSDDDTPFARDVKCSFIAEQLLSLNRIAAESVGKEEVIELLAPFRSSGSNCIPENDAEAAAAEMVVTRLQPGTPWSYAKIPDQEKRTFVYIPQPLHLALMDGKRSVLEAIKIYDVFNRNTMPPEKIMHVIKYLEYLEKYGYLTISKIS